MVNPSRESRNPSRLAPPICRPHNDLSPLVRMVSMVNPPRHGACCIAPLTLPSWERIQRGLWGTGERRKPPSEGQQPHARAHARGFPPIAVRIPAGAGDVTAASSAPPPFSLTGYRCPLPSSKPAGQSKSKHERRLTALTRQPRKPRHLTTPGTPRPAHLLPTHRPAPLVRAVRAVKHAPQESCGPAAARATRVLYRPRAPAPVRTALGGDYGVRGTAKTAI